VKTLNVALKYFLVFLMIVMFVLTTLQITLRYVFNVGLSWSEELVRFVFVWATFLAAAIGIREHIHIGVDAVVNLLRPALRRYADTVVYLVIIAFGVIMITAGIQVVQLTHSQLSPAMMMPMSYVYIAIPIGGALCLVYAIGELVRVWNKAGKNGEK
jgi:TRAP-type C4-dicarboxylate transport system permease small subunit